MSVKKIPAKISLHEFGQAMSQLNLKNVAPHLRNRALMDHLMSIEEDTVIDKEYATQIAVSRRLRDSQKDYQAIIPSKPKAK